MDDSKNDPTDDPGAAGRRRTRGVPERSDVDRSFGNLYGAGSSQAPEVESTFNEAVRTMESLLDDDSGADMGEPSGDFGHPFAAQSGTMDASRRLGELWLEQVQVWQEFIQGLVGSFSLPNADVMSAMRTMSTPAFDYSQLFKPDVAGFQSTGAPTSSGAPATVIISNRDNVNADVNWKSGTPGISVQAQGPFPVNGNELAKAVQVRFRLSVDGMSQVMMIDVAEDAAPGSYTGVICDTSGDDHGYFRVTVPG